MKRITTFCHYIDLLNDWVGKIARWAVLLMTVLIVLDVTLRYSFNKPTIWVWDINIQLLAFIAVMGAGYTFLHGAHVIVDVVALHFSPRARAMIDVVTSSLFLFSIVVIVWRLGDKALSSVQMKETTVSVFSPPVYPLRVAIVLGVSFLILQVIAKFFRDLNIAVNGVGKDKI